MYALNILQKGFESSHQYRTEVRGQTEVSTAALLCLICLAGYLHLFILLLFSDLVLFISYFFAKVTGKIEEEGGMSSFCEKYRLSQVLLVTIVAVSLISVGLYRTFTPPSVVDETFKTTKFKPGSELQIALLSDLHIGPSVGRKRVQTIVDVVNSINPDIIAISGDLADGYVKDLGEAAKPLCELRSKYGVYFATGNHEYYHGNVEEWFTFLRGCNITVLHNENFRLTTGKGESVCMAGIDDLITLKLHMHGHQMNPRKALAGCQKSDLVVLLAHQPNAARYVLSDPATNGNVDVVLSGHTHNGQFIFFVPFVHLANAWTHGLYWNVPTNTHILVSAGVDFFGPPVRTSGYCEVVRLTIAGKS
ncbi:unnamed protein product, partial [Mesorhabditis spiculigera]